MKENEILERPNFFFTWFLSSCAFAFNNSHQPPLSSRSFPAPPSALPPTASTMALQLLQAAHALEYQSEESDIDLHSSDFEVPYLASTSTKQSRYGTEDGEMLHEKSEATSGHNSVEKKRRAFLAKCYITLKEQVPAVRSIKASNATVLQQAARLIEELCTEEVSLLEEIRAQKKIQQSYLTALKNHATALTAKRKFTPAQTPPKKRLRRDGCDTRSSPVTSVPVAHLSPSQPRSCDRTSTLNGISRSSSSLVLPALLQGAALLYCEESFQTAPQKGQVFEDAVVGLMINGSALDDTVIGLMLLGAGPWVKEGLEKKLVSAGSHHYYHHHHHDQHKVPTVLDEQLCGLV